MARQRRPNVRCLRRNTLPSRLDKNSRGVPEEKLAVPYVAREHGIGGVSGLLPDLERGDTGPRRARREASAQAMARIPLRIEPCGAYPIANNQGYGFAGEPLGQDSPVSIDGRNIGPPSICVALSQFSSEPMFGRRGCRSSGRDRLGRCCLGGSRGSFPR
jgi:hypothetical protein